MSFHGKIEDKSIVPVGETQIPEHFVKEYVKVCEVLASETDAERLDAAQVKFRLMLSKMGTLKIFIPMRWSDTHNDLGEKAGRIRAAEFQRRTR